jgi:hypothetical protein
MDSNQQGQRSQPPMHERALLFDELRRAIARAEDLLRATRQHVDPSCADAREQLQAILRAAHMQLARYDDGKMETAGATSKTGEAKIFGCFDADADN